MELIFSQQRGGWTIRLDSEGEGREHMVHTDGTDGDVTASGLAPYASPPTRCSLLPIVLPPRLLFNPNFAHVNHHPRCPSLPSSSISAAPPLSPALQHVVAPEVSNRRPSSSRWGTLGTGHSTYLNSRTRCPSFAVSLATGRWCRKATQGHIKCARTAC